MKNGKVVILGLTLLLAIFLIFVSCATIVKGTKQEISVSSNPSQADLKIMATGGIEVYNGKTPATVKLARKNEYDVLIYMEGYKEEKVHISKGFNGWYLGNLICGGVIGLIVDAANGAMYKLEPDVVNVSLATALNGDGTKEYYAFFRALDSEGQLRTLLIPLVKK